MRSNSKINVDIIDTLEEFGNNGNISCHWWNDTCFSKHCHSFYEVFVVNDGITEHIINDKSSKIGAQTMCIIRPNDIHESRKIDENPCMHFNIAVDIDLFKETCDYLSPSLFDSINSEDIIQFTLSNDSYRFLISLAEKLHTAKNLGIGEYEIDNNNELKNIYAKQILTYSLSMYVERKINSAALPQWFEELLQKINSLQYIGYKASDIYKMSNYSPASLIAYFKEYTGETVAQYLQTTKINCACNLLETTNHSVLEIASIVGYNSLSHFSAIFKKTTGYTPAEYRSIKQQRHTPK